MAADLFTQGGYSPGWIRMISSHSGLSLSENLAIDLMLTLRPATNLDILSVSLAQSLLEAGHGYINRELSFLRLPEPVLIRVLEHENIAFSCKF